MSVLKQISVRLNVFVFGSCVRTLAVILFQIFAAFNSSASGIRPGLCWVTAAASARVRGLTGLAVGVAYTIEKLCYSSLSDVLIFFSIRFTHCVYKSSEKKEEEEIPLRASCLIIMYLNVDQFSPEQQDSSVSVGKCT